MSSVGLSHELKCISNVVHGVVALQAPQTAIASDLTAEEVQNVELFIRNTPSVVNIANIGEYSFHNSFIDCYAYLFKGLFKTLLASQCTAR